MKYLLIIPLLFAGTLNAQTTFTSLKSFDSKSLDFRMDHFTTRNFYPLQLNLPNQSVLDQQNYQSTVKLFSPQQYNIPGYPMSDLSDMDDFLMGTTLSNTVQLGKRKIKTMYIFDMNGDLRSSETSFSIGKKKK